MNDFCNGLHTLTSILDTSNLEAVIPCIQFCPFSCSVPCSTPSCVPFIAILPNLFVFRLAFFVAALLSGSELINDPFVPMRGRRFSNQALKNAFISMRGQRLATSDWDDPFVPMRGRKADQNSYDDPFIPMRGRRGNDKNGAAREQRSKPMPADLYLNDPFIPMRGRRSTPSQQHRWSQGKPKQMLHLLDANCQEFC